MTTSAAERDVIALRDAILSRLRTQSKLQVFEGQPDDAGQPKVALDPDGRVGMGAALYMGLGAPDTYTGSVCGDAGVLPVTFQVTAFGGDMNRALRAALKVRAALTDQHLTATSGRCREVLDQMNARPDSTASPSRWSVPMVYAVDLP